MSTAKASKPFEIFKPGTHTDASGAAHTFSEADVNASAAAYDPALWKAPIVVGHPKTDNPAYGWVAALDFSEDRLRAMPDQVEPTFAEMVRAGRFSNVSASFYRPDSPANPKPGVWYLKHVGFLGAQPPAIKGLKPVEFAAGDDQTVTLTVDFAEASGLPLLRMFRRIRDFLIDKFDQETADKVLPPYELDWAQEDAIREEVRETLPPPSFTEPATPTNEGEPSMADAAKAAELAAREEALKKREAAFAEQEKTQRGKDNAAFLDGLIAEGKFLPANKAQTLAFMEHLDASQIVEFNEGDSVKKQTALDAYKADLAARPKVVEFAEVAKDKGGNADTADFAAPPGFSVDQSGLELHGKAIAYQAKHPGTDYMTAVKAVGGK